MGGERDTYQSGGDDCKGSGNRSGMNFLVQKIPTPLCAMPKVGLAVEDGLKLALSAVKLATFSFRRSAPYVRRFRVVSGVGSTLRAGARTVVALN